MTEYLKLNSEGGCDAKTREATEAPRRAGALAGFFSSVLFFLSIFGVPIGAVILGIRVAAIGGGTFDAIMLPLSLIAVLGVPMLLLSIKLASVSGKRERAARDKAMRESLAKPSADCITMRAFYGYREPAMATKCLYSSDAAFAGKDVALFVTDGALVICTNVCNNSIMLKNDIGGYRLPDVTLSEDEGEDGTRCAVIRCGSTYFALAKRAIGFIKNNFGDKVTEENDKSI